MGVSFSINFPIEPFKIIRENSEIFLMGSCFTEHIGTKLNNAGFKTFVNPFGILFNPVSITNAIKRIVNKQVYSIGELIKNQEGRYCSFDHHGFFSNIDKDKTIDEINVALLEAHENLKKTECIIITLGSAWIYRHIGLNKLVANCHKLPNTEFEKQLLSVDKLVDSIKEAIVHIRTINPNSKIIFTISPVKHLRDGIVENQQSKASLIMALGECLKAKDENLYYFPAYEIVTDELRDYRFFEADHCHPNQLAIDYVWERFTETCFSPKAIEKALDAEKLNKALAHKTLHNVELNENLMQRINNYLKKYK